MTNCHLTQKSSKTFLTCFDFPDFSLHLACLEFTNFLLGFKFQCRRTKVGEYEKVLWFLSQFFRRVNQNPHCKKRRITENRSFSGTFSKESWRQMKSKRLSYRPIMNVPDSWPSVQNWKCTGSRNNLHFTYLTCVLVILSDTLLLLAEKKNLVDIFEWGFFCDAVFITNHPFFHHIRL